MTADLRGRGVKCPYCDKDARRVLGVAIYPHRPDLHAKPFWQCKPCAAWVGCHPGTDNPLGRLANAELRREKQRAHAAFDPIWRSGRMKRKEAYTWLAKETNIAVQNCHIGMMDADQCRAVQAAVRGEGLK